MLRVATYNAHDCIGRDGVYAPERIAHLVSNLRADVVALQEITLDHAGDVLGYLESITQLQAIDGTLFDRGVGRYGNLLLTRYPVIEQNLHDLSVAEHEPRGLVDASLQIADRAWRVLATHLGLSRRERQKQIARISRLLADDSRPTLIMGDFNIWLGAGAFAPLTALGFRQERVGSFPTWLLSLLSLDKIWVRGPARILRCWRYESSVARIASDHFPILAELSA
jgi:endonuclease/exonuclease/phosphatase family metal-dependent hydrolase